jgi:hypothetical protein
VLYVVPSRVSPFIGPVITDDEEEGVEVTQEVTGHTRRRYPGGPEVNVNGHNRQRLVGGYAAEQTLPGKNAWFERRETGLFGAVTSRVQFTFVGTTKQLRDYVAANGVGTFILRTPDGKAVPIVP